MPMVESSKSRTPKQRQPLLKVISNSKRRIGKAAGRSVPFTIISTLVVALGPISFGFSLGYSSPIQAEIISSLKLNLSQFSFFGSLVNVGAMTGALVSGGIAEFYGRKGALVAAAVPHIIGWLLIATCQSVNSLYLGRALVGFGVGIISFTVPVYIAEISPRHLRGSLVTVNQLAVTVGILLAYLGGLFLSWRNLAVAGVFPCSLLLLGLVFIPESPRWLAKVGRDEDALDSLQSLRGNESDISLELGDIKSSVEESKLQPDARLSDLLQSNLARPLLVGIGLQILQQFGGINAVMFYAGEIFRSAGFPSANLASLGLGSLQVVMTAVAAVLMDKAGRRLLLMVSAGGMAVSAFLVGLAFYLQEQSIEPTYLNRFAVNLSFVGLLVYIMSFSLGMGAIPWIVMSEIFPGHVRSLAGSLATLANWTGSWAVTMTFNFLLAWSAPGSFWVFAVESFLTVVFVALYVPETRGRTLEEIEAFFK